MKRRILSLLLVSALVMSGCGAKTAESASAEANTESSEESTGLSTDASHEDISTEIASEETSVIETSATPSLKPFQFTKRLAISIPQEWNQKTSEPKISDSTTQTAYFFYPYNTTAEGTIMLWIMSADDMEIFYENDFKTLLENSSVDGRLQNFAQYKSRPETYVAQFSMTDYDAIGYAFQGVDDVCSILALSPKGTTDDLILQTAKAMMDSVDVTWKTTDEIISDANEDMNEYVQDLTDEYVGKLEQIQNEAKWKSQRGQELIDEYMNATTDEERQAILDELHQLYPEDDK